MKSSQLVSEWAWKELNYTKKKNVLEHKEADFTIAIISSAT